MSELSHAQARKAGEFVAEGGRRVRLDEADSQRAEGRMERTKPTAARISRTGQLLQQPLPRTHCTQPTLNQPLCSTAVRFPTRVATSSSCAMSTNALLLNH